LNLLPHPTMPKFVLLWTDAAIWLLVLAVAAYAVQVPRRPELSRNWAKVFRNAPAMASSLILLACLGVTLLDSVHYRKLLPPAQGLAAGAPAYDSKTVSLLDAVLADLVATRESTYSRPLDCVGFTKESLLVNGEVRRVALRLEFGCKHLADPATQRTGDIFKLTALGLLYGLLAAVVLTFATLAVIARLGGSSLAATWTAVRQRQGQVPWHVALGTLWVMCLVAGPASTLSGPYHLLGTDLTGNDVLYQSLKSIRCRPGSASPFRSRHGNRKRCLGLG